MHFIAGRRLDLLEAVRAGVPALDLVQLLSCACQRQWSIEDLLAFTEFELARITAVLEQLQAAWPSAIRSATGLHPTRVLQLINDRWSRE
eukprot:m.170549 g.170549  ORF g.170549 m.170549 type:complete len:90 (+) comp53257_c0_seq1:1212-1481(+)